MIIKYATISECGRRSNNEDSFRIVSYPEEHRWMGIVCDGLGGHAMGEVASAIVADTIAAYYEQHRKETDSPQMLKDACQKAMAQLNARADQLRHMEMGTTMVAAVIDGQSITIVHMGDSRCYLLKGDGKIAYQTRDHTRLSFGFEVLDKCFISYHPQVIAPEIVRFDLATGDRLLLCSDGLYKSMPPEILLDRIADDKSPSEILNILTFLCEKNGDDNYTAIFVEIK